MLLPSARFGKFCIFCCNFDCVVECTICTIFQSGYVQVHKWEEASCWLQSEKKQGGWGAGRTWWIDQDHFFYLSRLRMLGRTPLTRASWRSMWRVLLPRPSCTGVQGWMINNLTLPTKGWADTAFSWGGHSTVQICVNHVSENCRPHHGKRDCAKVKCTDPRRKTISCFSPSTPGI